MLNAGIPRFLLAALLTALATGPLAAQSDQVARIIQTNSAGTNAHLIDPETHEVLAVVEGVMHAHGVAEHPEGLYYYFSNESHSTVDVFDTRTLEMVDQIPLSGRPNNISMANGLRKLYVGIRGGGPYTDVIDIDTHEVVKTVRMFRPVHNIYVTDDEKWAVASLAPGPEQPEHPSIEIIDTSTDEIAWGIPVKGVRTRPLAIESNPDGSPKRIFAQASEHHGFFVIDWDTREIVDFKSPPPVPLSQVNADGRQDGPSHGLEVLPDNSAVWDVSRITSTVYGYSLPDLEYIGSVHVGLGGGGADWATSSPDGRYLFVAVTGAGETVVVDLETLEVVKRIPVGHAPKRVHTALIPADRVEIRGGSR